MTITYYDKRKEDIVHLKSAKEIVISLDHETGLLEMTYKVERCYFTNYIPITSSIVIGDEND